MGQQSSQHAKPVKENLEHEGYTHTQLIQFTEAAEVKRKKNAQNFGALDVDLTTLTEEAAAHYNSSFSLLMQAQELDHERKDLTDDEYRQMMEKVLAPLPGDSMEINQLPYSRKLEDIKRIVGMYKKGDDFMVTIPFSKSFEEVREVLAVFGCRDDKLEELLKQNNDVLVRALHLVQKDAKKGYLHRMRQVEVTQKGLSDTSMCEITLDLDYEAFVKKDEHFHKKFLSELSQELKIPRSHLKISRVERGSIIVTVAVLGSIAALCLAGWARHKFSFETLGLSRVVVATVVAIICGATGAALGAGVGAATGAIAGAGVGAGPGAALGAGLGAGVGGAGGFVFGFGLVYAKSLKDPPAMIARVTFEPNPDTRNYEVLVQFHDPR